MHSSKLKNKPLLKFEAIGTKWIIEGDISAEIATRIKQRITEFDEVYSRFLPYSLVRRMSEQAGEYVFPDEAKDLVSFYQELYDVSEGKVTPLIGGALEEAGYDSKYSFIPSQTLHKPPSLDDVFSYQFPKITLRQPALLDFGGAGKGYLVDIIARLLKEAGIKSFCINAGGDILVEGKPQRVGLEDPAEPPHIIGTVQVENSALCGSAPNRRHWGRYHHILDPDTLSSPQHIQAIWVKAKTALYADGLSTALFFVKPTTLRKKFDFEYAIIENENMYMSEGFNAKLFMRD